MKSITKKYGMILALLAALCLSVGLVFLTACGSEEDSSTASSSTASESDTAEESSESETDADSEEEALVSWVAAGTCTLDCYSDGTYVFGYPDYGVSESGTWSWTDWSFTVTKPSGDVITADMDDDYNLVLVYTSDISEQLYDTFTLDSTTWGTVLGMGTYTVS